MHSSCSLLYRRIDYIIRVEKHSCANILTRALISAAKFLQAVYALQNVKRGMFAFSNVFFERRGRRGEQTLLCKRQDQSLKSDFSLSNESFFFSFILNRMYTEYLGSSVCFQPFKSSFVKQEKNGRGEKERDDGNVECSRRKREKIQNKNKS